MNLFSSSMAACLVSPLNWMYSFLLMHTFCLRNSSSSAFLVASVVSTTFFRFLGSGVYTFQRHFLLDVVAERAADAQVHVLELDGFGADFLFLVVGLAQAFQRSAEESEFSQFHDVSVGKEVAQLVNAGIQCCSYHILGQMLESCDMFHKLLLGISPFRADTCME